MLHIRTFLYACAFFLSSLISVKSLCIFLYSRVNVYFYALIYVYLSMLSYLCISVFNLQQVGKRLVPVSSGQCVIFVNVNVCLFPSALRLPYFCIYLCSSFVYFSMFSYLCISVFNLRQVGRHWCRCPPARGQLLRSDPLLLITMQGGLSSSYL